MTLRPSATFHLHSETATTGEESQPWFAMEASIISALSAIPRLTAFATSPSTVGNAGEGASREAQQMEESGKGWWLRSTLQHHPSVLRGRYKALIRRGTPWGGGFFGGFGENISAGGGGSASIFYWGRGGRGV